MRCSRICCPSHRLRRIASCFQSSAAGAVLPQSQVHGNMFATGKPGGVRGILGRCLVAIVANQHVLLLSFIAIVCLALFASPFASVRIQTSSNMIIGDGQEKWEGIDIDIASSVTTVPMPTMLLTRIGLDSNSAASSHFPINSESERNQVGMEKQTNVIQTTATPQQSSESSLTSTPLQTSSHTSPTDSSIQPSPTVPWPFAQLHIDPKSSSSYHSIFGSPTESRLSRFAVATDQSVREQIDSSDSTKDEWKDARSVCESVVPHLPKSLQRLLLVDMETVSGGWLAAGDAISQSNLILFARSTADVENKDEKKRIIGPFQQMEYFSQCMLLAISSQRVLVFRHTVSPILRSRLAAASSGEGDTYEAALKESSLYWVLSSHSPETQTAQQTQQSNLKSIYCSLASNRWSEVQQASTSTQKRNSTGPSIDEEMRIAELDLTPCMYATFQLQSMPSKQMYQFLRTQHKSLDPYSYSWPIAYVVPSSLNQHELPFSPSRWDRIQRSLAGMISRRFKENIRITIPVPTRMEALALVSSWFCQPSEWLIQMWREEVIQPNSNLNAAQNQNQQRLSKFIIPNTWETQQANSGSEPAPSKRPSYLAFDASLSWLPSSSLTSEADLAAHAYRLKQIAAASAIHTVVVFAANKMQKEYLRRITAHSTMEDNILHVPFSASSSLSSVFMLDVLSGARVFVGSASVPLGRLIRRKHIANEWRDRILNKNDAATISASTSVLIDVDGEFDQSDPSITSLDEFSALSQRRSMRSNRVPVVALHKQPIHAAIATPPPPLGCTLTLLASVGLEGSGREELDEFLGGRLGVRTDESLNTLLSEWMHLDQTVYEYEERKMKIVDRLQRLVEECVNPPASAASSSPSTDASFSPRPTAMRSLIRIRIDDVTRFDMFGYSLRHRHVNNALLHFDVFSLSQLVREFNLPVEVRVLASTRTDTKLHLLTVAQKYKIDQQKPFNDDMKYVDPIMYLGHIFRNRARFIDSQLQSFDPAMRYVFHYERWRFTDSASEAIRLCRIVIPFIPSLDLRACAASFASFILSIFSSPVGKEFYQMKNLNGALQLYDAAIRGLVVLRPPQVYVTHKVDEPKNNSSSGNEPARPRVIDDSLRDAIERLQMPSSCPSDPAQYAVIDLPFMIQFIPMQLRSSESAYEWLEVVVASLSVSLASDRTLIIPDIWSKPDSKAPNANLQRVPNLNKYFESLTTCKLDTAQCTLASASSGSTISLSCPDAVKLIRHASFDYTWLSKFNQHQQTPSNTSWSSSTIPSNSLMGLHQFHGELTQFALRPSKQLSLAIDRQRTGLRLHSSSNRILSIMLPADAAPQLDSFVYAARQSHLTHEFDRVVVTQLSEVPSRSDKIVTAAAITQCETNELKQKHLPHALFVAQHLNCANLSLTVSLSPRFLANRNNDDVENRLMEMFLLSDVSKYMLLSYSSPASRLMMALQYRESHFPMAFDLSGRSYQDCLFGNICVSAHHSNNSIIAALDIAQILHVDSIASPDATVDNPSSSTDHIRMPLVAPSRVVKRNFDASVKLVFVVGIEGTGHHYISQLIGGIRSMNPTNPSIIVRSNEALTLSFWEFTRKRDIEVYTQGHTWNEKRILFRDILKREMHKLREDQTRAAAANGVPVPALLMLNCLDEMFDVKRNLDVGMLSYPNNAGPMRHINHADVITLAEICEDLNIDLRVVALSRAEDDSFLSMWTRFFEPRWKLRRSNHVDMLNMQKTFLQQTRVLHQNLIVAQSELNGIDRAFNLEVPLELLQLEPQLILPQLAQHFGVTPQLLIDSSKQIAQSFEPKPLHRYLRRTPMFHRMYLKSVIRIDDLLPFMQSHEASLMSLLHPHDESRAAVSSTPQCLPIDSHVRHKLSASVDESVYQIDSDAVHKRFYHAWEVMEGVPVEALRSMIERASGLKTTEIKIVDQLNVYAPGKAAPRVATSTHLVKMPINVDEYVAAFHVSPFPATDLTVTPWVHTHQGVRYIQLSRVLVVRHPVDLALELSRRAFDHYQHQTSQMNLRFAETSTLEWRKSSDSWMKKQFELFLRKVLENYNGWIEMHEKKHDIVPRQRIIVKYENLISQTSLELKNIFSFVQGSTIDMLTEKSRSSLPADAAKWGEQQRLVDESKIECAASMRSTLPAGFVVPAPQSHPSPTLGRTDRYPFSWHELIYLGNQLVNRYAAKSPAFHELMKLLQYS